MTVEPTSTYNAERSRVEVLVDGELVAFVDLRPAGPSTIIAHTEVVEGHEQQGLGRVAVRAAVDHILGEDKTIIAVCPFARALLQRDPELARAST